MATDFVYVYPYSHSEAEQSGKLELWEKSFRENIACSRDIERAVQSGMAFASTAILEKYGFKRTNYVLANTIKLTDEPISAATKEWGRQTHIQADRKNNRHFFVDIGASDLEALITQVQKAYQALELFDYTHCIDHSWNEDYTGKVLVLSASALKESHWKKEEQLWLGESGFGCDPNANGRAVYALCLADGEHERWSRSDFAGILQEQLLPDWAKAKLDEIQAKRAAQQTEESPAPGGMIMS